MQRFLQFSLAVLACLLLTACSVANLQTDALADGRIPDAESKGRQLLQMTYEKMGYDNFAVVDVYEFTANFDWSTGWSMMPMNALPGNKNKNIQFRYAPRTFDGQVEFLEGPRQGHVYGLQSWETYQRDASDAPVEDLKSKRYPWGLTAYQYILEGPMRLLGADYVRYAGEREFDGQHYDLVFVTWGDGTQKTKYDQYLVYINKETGFTDLSEITITDFFLPMPNGMKNATARYPERKQTTAGIWLPTKTIIQLGHPKEKVEKDVYTYTMSDYKFNSFPKEVLYPMEGLRYYGDSKPEEAR